MQHEIHTLHIKLYLYFRKASNYAEMCPFNLPYTCHKEPPYLTAANYSLHVILSPQRILDTEST